MDKEKNLDAGANQPQEKVADESLNEEELDNVAGSKGVKPGHNDDPFFEWGRTGSSSNGN